MVGNRSEPLSTNPLTRVVVEEQLRHRLLCACSDVCGNDRLICDRARFAGNSPPYTATELVNTTSGRVPRCWGKSPQVARRVEVDAHVEMSKQSSAKPPGERRPSSLPSMALSKELTIGLYVCRGFAAGAGRLRPAAHSTSTSVSVSMAALLLLASLSVPRASRVSASRRPRNPAPPVMTMFMWLGASLAPCVKPAEAVLGAARRSILAAHPSRAAEIVHEMEEIVVVDSSPRSRAREGWARRQSARLRKVVAEIRRR